MRLCLDNERPADALDQAGAVLAFMTDALCGAREEPWESDEKLWGAQLVFEALGKDLEEISAVMRNTL